ncbi:protein of unknown function (plasmid) [Cupriavidus neocaledonicus]|uniref:Uncharacterized protein n=1 Tax=Cupriavidus neocaledonicus TaxID=1040979 RepID=A0A375HPJ3_9BURK|nr:protein of unknown function [Cupriavidus neocaledonicus]
MKRLMPADSSAALPLSIRQIRYLVYLFSACVVGLTVLSWGVLLHYRLREAIDRQGMVLRAQSEELQSTLHRAEALTVRAQGSLSRLSDIGLADDVAGVRDAQWTERLQRRGDRPYIALLVPPASTSLPRKGLKDLADVMTFTFRVNNLQYREVQNAYLVDLHADQLYVIPRRLNPARMLLQRDDARQTLLRRRAVGLPRCRCGDIRAGADRAGPDPDARGGLALCLAGPGLGHRGRGRRGGGGGARAGAGWRRGARRAAGVAAGGRPSHQPGGDARSAGKPGAIGRAGPRRSRGPVAGFGPALRPDPDRPADAGHGWLHAGAAPARGGTCHAHRRHHGERGTRCVRALPARRHRPLPDQAGRRGHAARAARGFLRHAPGRAYAARAACRRRRAACRCAAQRPARAGRGTARRRCRHLRPAPAWAGRRAVGDGPSGAKPGLSLAGTDRAAGRAGRRRRRLASDPRRTGAAGGAAAGAVRQPRRLTQRPQPYDHYCRSARRWRHRLTNCCAAVDWPRLGWKARMARKRTGAVRGTLRSPSAT